jgi:hypothetical protein
LADLINKRALVTIYDTAKSLKRKDLVLAQGQIGVESDTLQIKIGNGYTPWNYLPYAVTNGGSGNDLNMIVANDDSEIVGTISGTETSLNLSALKAADERPPGAKAFVKILALPSE